MSKIGLPAPQFTAPAVVEGGEFKDISLSSFKGKWVVLFFYPLDFTFVCPTEILQFHEKLNSFEELGAQVLGVSVDSVHSHRKWIQDDLGELQFPLIGDLTKKLSRDYDVLIENEGIATRGTFIIDPEGRVQYESIHNLNIGRDVNEILRVLTGLQSGELCSAGWKPGDDFVKPRI